MTDADWVRAFLAVGGLLIVGWITWVTRAASGALSRAEHEKICEARESRIENTLHEIKELMKEQAEQATKTRHRMNNRIQEIGLCLAARGYVLPKVSDEEDGR